LILCLALLRVFKTAIIARFSPANIVLYGSVMGWSCVGSLCQSTEIGSGYLFYLGGLVGLGLINVVAR